MAIEKKNHCKEGGVYQLAEADQSIIQQVHLPLSAGTNLGLILCTCYFR